MSESRDEGSIDAQVDAVLREMVAGEGSADLRARVMAATGRERQVGRGSRAFPWPRLVLMASLLVAAVAMLGRVRFRDPSPEPLPAAARALPAAAPTPNAEAQIAPLVSSPAVMRSPAAPRRPTRLAQAADSAREDFLPPLEVPPIEDPSPLVLPPIRTTSLDASSLAFPALEIKPLPAEPPPNGSF